MTAIGHNSGDAHTIARDTIVDLVGEARAWLDGKPVADKDQADGLAHLLDLLRKAHKHADDARAAEKRPHDDAAKAVQAKWKPLLASAERATDAVKAAIATWQREEQRKADEAARIAREAAEAAAREAQAKRAAADAADLAAREAADAALAEAERLQRAAAAAEKASVGAKGAFAARRTALVVTRVPVAIVDGTAALRWAMQTRGDDLRWWLLDEARRHKGGDVPGVQYEERETVR